MPSLSIRRLYQDNQKKLQLSWIAGSSNLDKRISIVEVKSNWSLVGHFNFVHPNKIQVIGISEYEFIKNKLSQDRFGFFLDFIAEMDVGLVIIANDLEVIPELKDFCVTHAIPLMHSKIESPKLLDVLRLYLQKALAISTVMHGVFLNVFEVGVLITGDPSLGKSELALELISRGHSLIADDAVTIYRIGPETLEGRCHHLLQDFLEVRGLGILNIRTMFGETAIRIKKELKLIINLVHVDDDYMKNVDRLSARRETETILDVVVRKTIIPVAAGRNIAILTETAVRNHILLLRGKDSLQEFLERHNTAMSAPDELPDDEDCGIFDNE